MSHTSKYLLLICSIILFENNIYSYRCETDSQKAAAAMGGLLGIAGTRWAIHKFSETTASKKIAHTTGLHPSQVKNIATVSIGMLTLAACLSNPIYLPFAWKAPIVGLLGQAVISKQGQEVMKEVPLIGPAITCQKHECSGVCTECFPTKAIALAGIWYALKGATEVAVKWYSGK